MRVGISLWLVPKLHLLVTMEAKRKPSERSGRLSNNNNGKAHVTEDLLDNPEHGRLIKIAGCGVPSLVVSYLYTRLGLPAPDYKLTHRTERST